MRRGRNIMQKNRNHGLQLAERWPIIMSILLDELCYGNYTHIYLMQGWQNSSGAVIEQCYAKRLGMEFIYEVERD